MSIGERVRRAREARHWTLGQLARRTGLGTSYLSQLERGRVVSPAAHRVRSLASALGVGAASLLDPPTNGVSRGPLRLLPLWQHVDGARLPEAAVYSALRELGEAGDTVRASTPHLAARVGMSADGVRRVLLRLGELAVVEPAERGYVRVLTGLPEGDG